MRPAALVMEHATTVLPESGYQTVWPHAPAGPPPPKRKRLAFLRELPALIVIAFALAVLMKTFLIQAFFIPSESMEPTLHGCTGCTGDRVLVNKLVYRFREPRRGEVIVFVAERDRTERSVPAKIRHWVVEAVGIVTPSETDFIKRVIGLPGEKIEVTREGVFITPPGGERSKLDEPYVMDQADHGQPYREFLIPQDSYFVMGDNRTNSADSRVRGPVARADIIGKAFVKIFPIKRIDLIDVPRYQGIAAGDSSGADPGAPLPVLVAFAVTPLWRRDS